MKKIINPNRDNKTFDALKYALKELGYKLDCNIDEYFFIRVIYPNKYDKENYYNIRVYMNEKNIIVERIKFWKTQDNDIDWGWDWDNNQYKFKWEWKEINKLIDELAKEVKASND